VGQSDVEVAKNKLGVGYPEFRIRLDFSTLAVEEIGSPADSSTGPRAAARKPPSVLDGTRAPVTLRSAARGCGRGE
jgi:hypothetical protein